MTRPPIDIRLADHPGAPTPDRPKGSGTFQLAARLIDIADQARRDLNGAPEHQRLMAKLCEHWEKATRSSDLDRTGEHIEDHPATVAAVALPLPPPSTLNMTSTDRSGLLAGLRDNGWLRFTPQPGVAIADYGDPFRARR